MSKQDEIIECENPYYIQVSKKRYNYLLAIEVKLKALMKAMKRSLRSTKETEIEEG